jgi:Glycosyl hydrolase family 26
VVLAGLLGITASRSVAADPPAKPACTNSAPSTPAGGAVPADVEALLEDGEGVTAADYFENTSSALVAAAAGDDNASFCTLGALLVKDGFSGAIINLGREMNGSWYEWAEQRAPSSEPDAFILAWRQIVTAMRSVPGQHFKFLWTLIPGSASVADSWPGSAYVDYIGTDVFDWYGGKGSDTYPQTASGALNHKAKWGQILGAQPAGLDWMAAFSSATGKQIILPEWGLDFHSFGGQDDPYFITNILSWMKTNDAIGLYWGEQHVTRTATVSGPFLADQGEAGQQNTPGDVNGLGALLGGRLQYAGVYLPDNEPLSDSVDQPVLAPWQNAGYQLILSVPLVTNPPAIKSYSGPPEPTVQPYQLADYPDAVAAYQQGL